MNNKFLISRPAPCKDESLLSFQLRLCEANGYGLYQLEELSRSFAEAPLRSFKKVDRVKIKRAFSKLSQHAAVLDMFDPWEWADEYRSMFDYKRIKICPRCFSDRPIIKRHWHLRSSLICDKHSCYMVDSCDRCGEKLSGDSLIFGQCISCGQPLCSIAAGSSDSRVCGVVSSEFVEGVYSSVDMAEIFKHYRWIDPYILIIGDDAFKYWFKNRDAEINMLADIRSQAELFAQERFVGDQALVRCIKECETFGSFNKIFLRYIAKEGFGRFNEHVKRVLIEYSGQFKGMSVSIGFLAKLYGLSKEQLSLNLATKRSDFVEPARKGETIDASDVPRLIGGLT